MKINKHYLYDELENRLSYTVNTYTFLWYSFIIVIRIKPEATLVMTLLLSKRIIHHDILQEIYAKFEAGSVKMIH